MKPIRIIFASVSLVTLAACNNSAIKEKDQALQAQQHVIDSMNTELAKKKVIDSMNEVMSMQYVVPSTATVVTQSAPAVSSTRRTTKRTHSGRTRSANSTTVAQAPVYQEAPVTKHKKGWSAKAKGAVIGAGTGAAAGAIINKRNRAAGAVIGTVIGAAAGTGVGAVIDKKKGR